MNQRIKELAKQAGFAMNIDDDPNSPPGWWGAGHDPTFEKFAELIIAECAEAYHQTRPAGEPVDTFFRKHLGVE
jgi:hypothetical protein